MNEVFLCNCYTGVLYLELGPGASTALVEGLAHAGNGTAEFVKEGERLQPKVFITTQDLVDNTFMSFQQHRLSGASREPCSQQ